MAKSTTGMAWRKRPSTILWMLSLGQLISWGLVYYTFPLFVVPMTQELGWSRSGMFGALGSEKYQEYCHDIMTSGNYLLDVINDILDMSKIEAGRMKLDYEPLDLAQTLTESLRVVSGRAENKNLTLNADIRGAIPIVADRRAMKQIAVNLLSNAVKFTPDGGKVTVRSRMRNGSIILTIADSGIGIAPQSLAKLGRPFEQVESQLTKSYHGSGLGLAIAKSLASLHGGSMKLRSRLGVGTIVCVMLPCGHREQPAPSIIAETSLQAASGKPRARRSVSPARAPQGTKNPARRQPASALAEDPPQLFPA